MQHQQCDVVAISTERALIQTHGLCGLHGLCGRACPMRMRGLSHGCQQEFYGLGARYTHRQPVRNNSLRTPLSQAVGMTGAEQAALNVLSRGSVRPLLSLYNDPPLACWCDLVSHLLILSLFSLSLSSLRWSDLSSLRWSDIATRCCYHPPKPT